MKKHDSTPYRKDINRHESMRGYFAFELYQQMLVNDKIWCLTGDLGFGVLDHIRDDFPARFLNCGAAEVAMMDIAVGLSLSGKIPFVYSITPFLIYRAFEVLRTYINHEKINVKLIGSGRDKDYEHDGISHWSEDCKKILKTLPNIQQYYPIVKEDIPYLLDQTIKDKNPIFISLRR